MHWLTGVMSISVLYLEENDIDNAIYASYSEPSIVHESRDFEKCL